MRAVVQRVTEARVNVEEQVVGQIASGLLVLLGVEQGDAPADVKTMVDKIAGLRIFEDEAGLMNANVSEHGGALLVVSQFTLLGDVRRGKRPSFTAAAPLDIANELYQRVCQQLRDTGLVVEQGVFQADMQVSLVNDGPVTILIDTRKLF